MPTFARTPLHGQPQDEVTSRLPVLAEPPPVIPDMGSASRVLDGTPERLVGPLGLEPGTERL